MSCFWAMFNPLLKSKLVKGLDDYSLASILSIFEIFMKVTAPEDLLTRPSGR